MPAEVSGSPSSERGAPGSVEAAFDRIAVCVDGSEFGERVVLHALAVARAVGASVTLLRVLEGKAAREAPPDALDWDIRRQEARQYLGKLVDLGREQVSTVDAEVIEGEAAEEICLWAREHDVGLTVLCTHGVSGQTQWNLASTARKLVDGAPGSLLLVPAAGTTADARVAQYRRVLVPVDGSPRAENVLPLAKRLARAQGSELLLAHVIPVPELTEIGPLDAEDVELRERLVRRNERVASEYLDRLRARLADSDVPVRALVLRGGDPRNRLARLIVDEGVDLVVLSAHGRSARSDVPFGSVTAHLVEHAEAPLLILRSRPSASMRRVAPQDQEAVRLPSQATT